MAGRVEPRDLAGRWLEWLPLAAGRPLLAFGASTAIVALALALRFLLDGWMPKGVPFLTFLPATVTVGLLFGVRFGLGAGLVTGLLAWAIFLPQLEAAVLGPGATAALVVYALLVGVAMLLIHWIHRSTSRLVRERERNARLAETRHLLFRELQHRVSNNLQVAASLLTLQGRHIEQGNARAALSEAARRIGVIGRISRQLYRPDGGPQPLRELLEPLCADVLDASGGEAVTLCFIGVRELALMPDAAIPVALIVAEAVANAVEHGFAGRNAGRIDVAWARDTAGMLAIEICDDGLGLPEDFAIDAHGSLGLRIVTTLAHQLGGSFRLEPGTGENCPGARARLTLPAAHAVGPEGSVARPLR